MAPTRGGGAVDLATTQGLTQTVLSFVEGRAPVESVLEDISLKRAEAGQLHQLQRDKQLRAVRLAEETLRDTLKSRLRTAKSEIVIFGKKKLDNDQIDRFSQAFADARASGMLQDDAEVDLPGSEELLRNIKVRSEMKSFGDTVAAAKLPPPHLPSEEPLAGTALSFGSPSRGIAKQTLSRAASNPQVASNRSSSLRNPLGGSKGGTRFSDVLTLKCAQASASRLSRQEKVVTVLSALSEHSCGEEDQHLNHIVSIIRQHAKPSPEDLQERLSDQTLATCCRTLTRYVAGNWEACRKVVRLGVLGFLRRIFLSDRDEQEAPPMCGVDHPALQLALADIAAQIMLQGAFEAERRQHHMPWKATNGSGSGWASLLGHGRSRPGTAMSIHCSPSTASHDTGILDQISRNVVKGTLSGEAAWAAEALIEALAAAAKRYEHALVWGVLTALRRGAENHMCCQHLLLSGLLPLLRRLSRFYQACGERLPLPAERPKPRPPPVISPDPPELPRAAAAPALERGGESVKQRWLSQSASLPELQRAGHYISSGGSSQPAPVVAASPNKDTAVPPAMWLMGEEGDSIEAFYRECGRSYFLLRIESLVTRLEKCKTSLVDPLHQSRHDAKA